MQGKHSGSWPDAERNLVKSEQPYPMSENCLLKVRLGFPCWPLIICVSLGGLVPRACPSPIPLLPTQGSASLPAEGPELPTVPGCLLRIQPGSPQPIHAGQGHNPAMMPLLVKFPWKEIHPHPPLYPQSSPVNPLGNFQPSPMCGTPSSSAFIFHRCLEHLTVACLCP